MTRYMLRTGFSLVPAEGVGHLTDMPTGDVLVVPGADVPVLMTAATGGLDDTAPGAADVLARYRPFLVQALQSSRSFYELDIEDAPPLAPSISPVRSEAEDELRRALARSAAPAEEPAPPVAVPEVEAAAPQLSQEENLRRALEQARPAPTREEVAALLDEAAQELGIAAPVAAVAPSTPVAAPVSEAGRSTALTVLGVALLVLGVVASVVLRRGGEPTPEVSVGPADAGAAVVAPPDAGAPTLVAVAALHAGAPVDGGKPALAVVLDAGAPVAVAAPVDAGRPALAVAVDAGVPVVAVAAPVDAGRPALAAVVDAGVKPGGWFEAEVQARGRVKMSELVAPADGVLAWTVDEAQRVKSKQALGTVTKADGSQAALVAETVGLVMRSRAEGAPVKRGEGLAALIYFEAWARGTVRGAVPTPAWRCEVVSAASNQRAPCKISVVTPRGGSAQVTVAVEPRWFDDASDAVLRFAPVE